MLFDELRNTPYSYLISSSAFAIIGTAEIPIAAATAAAVSLAAILFAIAVPSFFQLYKIVIKITIFSVEVNCDGVVIEVYL